MRFAMKKQICSFCFLCISILLLTLSSCEKSTDFTVTGVVSGADGQTLYLENVGVSSVEIIDSAKLTAAGKFKFAKHRPTSPDFYRLRLNNHLINFAIDSTEAISFTADAGTFATSYSVEGSENNIAIRNITLAQLDANQAINRLRKEYEGGQLVDTTYARLVRETVDAYKTMALQYIYTAPMSTAAYFALFQQIDGLLFFDLYDKNDSRAFAAVATSLDHNYPESARAKHLHNLTLQSLKVIRAQREINLDNVNVNEISFLDIALPNIQGKEVKLSEVAPGKVVLVNFTAYQSEWSVELNMELGDLYTKYSKNGLEIYQVSLDADGHLWRNAASNLPWVCVRDPQSVYSQVAALYNVKQLPALFIIDKKGNMVKRLEDINQLDKDIRALL